MTRRRVVLTIAAAALTLTSCSSSSSDLGKGGTPLDLDKTTCAQWASATDETRELNAESLLLVLRRAGKVKPESPTEDMVTGLVSDTDSGCDRTADTTMVGSVASAAVLNRSEFFLG